MQEVIFAVHIVVAVLIIALVLIQHGKGADAGAAFGSGASSTIFGSAGSMPFLVKVTALLAAVFFATNILLGTIVTKQVRQAVTNTKESSVPYIPD